MLYHALAHIPREGVRLGDGCIPDADHDSLALVEFPLNQPLVAKVEGLPATWEQNGPRLLKVVGQLVYEIVDALALFTTRVQRDMSALRLIEGVGNTGEVGNLP